MFDSTTVRTLALAIAVVTNGIGCRGAVDLGGNVNGDADVPDASSFDGGAPIDASVAADGGDANAPCLPAVRWPIMDGETLTPSRHYAGLDLAYSDQWEGLTLDQAEQIDCKSVAIAPGDAAWGFNHEVEALYDVDTRRIYELMLKDGYSGAVSFHDRGGTNQYVIRIGAQITKNGQPFEIPWDVTSCGSQNCIVQRDRAVTELYNAMMITFGPALGIPFQTDSQNCRTDRGCLASSDGGDGNAYFGVRPLQTYLTTPANSTQPMASTPSSIYVFFDKRVAFSNSIATLKIDAVGPSYAPQSLGGAASCALRVGMPWSELLSDCVQVTGNVTGDSIALNKLVGGRQHDLERWTFIPVDLTPDVYRTPVGVPIGTNDLPAPSDVVGGWRLTLTTSPPPSTNDMDAMGIDFDGHGTGLVFREWARLVQQDIYARLASTVTAHDLAAPECVGAMPVSGCTGLEELALPGLTYPSDSPAVAAFVAPDVYASVVLDLSSVAFCDDPGTFAQCPDEGALPTTARDRVVKVLGHGNAASLPAELRDSRYYYRWFAIALLRYLKAVGANASPTPSDVASAHISLESLSFDQRGTVPDDAFRYVERDFAASSGSPLVIEHVVNPTDGGTRGFSWSTRLESGEAALARAFAIDKQAVAGATNDINLTNVFGSPLLAATYASLHCATTIDPSGCSTSAAPPQDSPGQLTLDLDGALPELAHYPGVFGRSPFAKGASLVTILSTDAANARAQIRIPNEPDPYHGAQPPSGTLDAMVGWIDAAHAGGLTLARSTTQDQTVQRAQLRFLGNALSYVVHYRDGPSGTIVVDAIEASDFTGEVFLCADEATGDLLKARAYSSATVMLDWITAHPAASASCGLVTRSSGTAVKLIASTTNGVQLTMSTGDGAGRVVGAVVYDRALLP